MQPYWNMIYSGVAGNFFQRGGGGGGRSRSEAIERGAGRGRAGGGGKWVPPSHAGENFENQFIRMAFFHIKFICRIGVG